MNANDIDAEAIVGQTSQFDVIRNGELIYSKQERGRFPEHDEILSALRG